MDSDHSQKDDAKRTVEKLEEIVEKIKEAIGSISGHPQTSVQRKRQFWADKLQSVFLEYKTRKYMPPPVYPNLQQVLRRCSSSVPSDRSRCLADVDEFMIEEEKMSGKQSTLYGRALVHAVEVVSKIDAERALRIAEGIEPGEERTEALIYILESYIYSLLMMGIEV